MSLKICTAEYLLSDTRGVGPGPAGLHEGDGQEGQECVALAIRPAAQEVQPGAQDEDGRGEGGAEAPGERREGQGDPGSQGEDQPSDQHLGGHEPVLPFTAG